MRLELVSPACQNFLWLQTARDGVSAVHAGAFAKAGYEIVTAPGPNVLRIQTAFTNLTVTAPDTPQAGRVTTYSRDAGQATLLLEVRDSLSGALMGAAIDTREIGDTGFFMRNNISNRSEFSQAFQRWAKISVEALSELKAITPVGTNNKPEN